MSKFSTYYTRFSGVRSDLTGLPPWARTVFAIILIPGILLVGLSIVVVIISIVALLLVAIPVYTLLRALTRAEAADDSGRMNVPEVHRGEMKHVDSVVREASNNVPDEVDGG